MSADERRRPERASRQVEDRVEAKEFSGAGGYVPAGYGAGSDGGGGERMWERTPAASGWRESFDARRGEREAARRRVEANPEVMPPHPSPVDRAPEKKRAERSFRRRTLSFAAGMFVLGYLMPQAFARRRAIWPKGAWRSRRGRGPVIALRSRGWRGRRKTARLAELLRGKRFRGELVFE